MSDIGLRLVIFFPSIFVGFIWGYALGIDKGFSTIRTTETIVESVDIEKAVTSTGLVVENKGYHVGDTLVIIKK